MTRSEILTVELRPSYLLAGALALGHLLALSAAWISLEGWPRVLVLAGIALSGWGGIAGALHRTLGSAQALALRADGGCAWRDGEGTWRESRLGGAPFVSTVLIVFGLRLNTLRRKWIVLLPDAADDESLRRLRVWLLWRQLEDVPQDRKVLRND